MPLCLGTQTVTQDAVSGVQESGCGYQRGLGSAALHPGHCTPYHYPRARWWEQVVMLYSSFSQGCCSQELHMASAPAHQWQWLCVWAPVVTPVSIPHVVAVPRSAAPGQCVVEADGSFGAGAPLERASGHGTPTSQSTPVSIPKRGRETWRHSGGTWPCSILLEKGLVGNLVLLGLDETGCNTLPWDSLPQGISQPMGSVPSQRAISSDSSSGC